MTEALGFCEKHQLPLDRNGECELCRLSEMPSKAPPTPSAWWAVIIPLLLLIAGIAWAMSSFEAEPAPPPHRGVRTSAPQPVSPSPTGEESPPSEPLEIPEPPPAPAQETPAPEPGSEGTMLEEPAPQPEMANDAEIPEWKWNLARRRVSVTMYATRWCDVCKKAREYMEANRVEFIELDTDESTAASERLGELNPRKTVPTFQIDQLVYVGFQESLFQAKLNEAARQYL